MELRVLRYFLAAAREESVTGAANYLHLTQPTLSRQLRDLEEELGQKLFNRGGHRLTLTPAGMYLRKRAEEMVALADQTEADFRAMQGDIAGDIRIGGGETAAMTLVADVCRGLREAHPGIRCCLYSGNAEDVAERLDKGLIDFGLVIQPADIARYDCLSLPVKDRWGAIFPKTWALAGKKTISPEALRGVPLLLSQQVLDEENVLARWFGDLWKDLTVAATYNLIYNAAVMVKDGLGCVISLDGLADTSAESPLCFRPLEPALEAGIDVVWKKYQVFSPAAALFLEKLRERCGEQ